MRIGLLAPDLSANHGWATYSLNLIRQLRARGIQTTVLCARNSPPVDFDALPLLPAVRPPERHIFLKSLLQTSAARRAMASCDILHATIEPYAVLAAAIAGARPLFVTAHGSYVNLPRLRRFPVGRAYRWAFSRAQLLCVSRYTARMAREILPEARAQVINNGVDATRFLNPPASPALKEAPTVVAAGGVKPRKGTLELVEAMAHVRRRIPDARCLVLGDPQESSAYTARVRRRIAELALQESVSLLGFVDDALLRAWLAAADVVALPAVNDGLWFEGFGLVLVEAGASGTAVIGTDDCGVADAIDHGETGLVVSQRHIARELPRALLTLLEDPALAARMGAAGKRRAQQRTWAAVADQVVQRYKSSLA